MTTVQPSHDKSRPSQPPAHQQADTDAGHGSLKDTPAKSLRDFFRQSSAILHPRMIREIALHGHLSANIDVIEERPCSTASLSFATGIGPVEIGLLYDINLSRNLALAHNNAEERDVAGRILAEARSLRRAFNRLGKQESADLPTEDVVKVLRITDQRTADISMSGEQKHLLARSFDECAHHLQLAGRYLSWEVARESVAYVLGEMRELAVGARLHSVDVPPPAISLSTLARLRSSLEYLQKFATRCSPAAGSALPTVEERRHSTEQFRQLHSDGRGGIATSFVKTEVRSAPVKLIAASRRSLCANRLGMVHALDELAMLFEQSPTQAALQRVIDMLREWRAGELPVSLGVGGRGQETLSKHPFSVAGTSAQATFRDAVSPVLAWGASRFEELPADVQRYHLPLLLRSTVQALHALTVRDMALTLDAVRHERDMWQSNSRSKWSVPRAFPGGKVAQSLFSTSRSGSSLKAVLASIEHKPEGLGGQTIKEISSHFRGNPSEITAVHLRLLAEVSAWARTCAARYCKQVPSLPKTDSLWVTEYDGGAGTTLPQSVQSEFERMQEEVRIPRGSRRSGLIVPESAEWLRKHIYEHDGFLVTTNEGDVSSLVDMRKPAALVLATCSQTSPSPLMVEVAQRAASFIAALPKPATGTNPHVLCELAISTQDARFYRREYGEHAHQVLWEQTVFNLVARFPTAERIECFATCLEGTDAMKAHARFGWAKTGAVYQDQFGNTANIIHTTIHAAAIVLGYRDITS